MSRVSRVIIVHNTPTEVEYRLHCKEVAKCLKQTYGLDPSQPLEGYRHMQAQKGAEMSRERLNRKSRKMG